MEATAVTPTNQTVVKAMARAWAKIPTIEFDRENSHFRMRYATLSGIIATIRPMLAAEGLWLSQPVVEQGDGSVTIETILWHESGESLSFGRCSMPVNKADAQGYGSALTYACRYGLRSALCITTGEDDDDGQAAAEAKPKPEPRRTQAAKPDKAPAADAVIGSTDATRIIAAAAKRGVEKDDLLAFLRNEVAGTDPRVAGSPAQWPKAWGKEIGDWLRTLPKAGEAPAQMSTPTEPEPEPEGPGSEMY